MKSHLAAVYTFGVILGLALAIAPFVPRFRGGSSWLRGGLFITGLLAIANNSIGVYLLVYKVGDKTSLSSSQFWALDHLKLFITGLVLGMLACLFLSPECRRLNRPTNRSNQSLEPTAGPRDAHI